MNIKDTFSRAGSISHYTGYIIVLFVWYVINDLYTMIIPESSGGLSALISWTLTLLAGPIVSAAIYGGIYARQTTQNELERAGFFSNIKVNGLRFFSANAVSLLFHIILLMVFLFAGEETSRLAENKFFLSVLAALSSTIMLVWLAALVIERKLWRSLFRAIKTLLSTPAALGIGIVWFALDVAVNIAFDFSGGQTPVLIQVARAAVFAVLEVGAVMYFLPIYEHKWGIQIQALRAAKILDDAAMPRSGEKLAKTGLGFAFLSFIPFVHLVALFLGIASLKRRHGFILKAAIACWIGAFFTLLYAMLAVGYFVGQSNMIHAPDYSFLSHANEESRPYVDLLEQGAFGDVVAQLGDTSVKEAARDWSLDAALGLAEYKRGDINGALKDFSVASQKKPVPGEFYFYYGLALLKNDEADMAKEQFQLALAHNPNLKIAEQYIQLVQNRYKPDLIGSALIYLVVLMILFPLHEYGHAFAAWKLGDDTARLQGRLTLNPAAHLDIFGSIVLPAILLFQQSTMVFGWARPVPVDTNNFKRPEKDNMLVAFAGPAVNLMVAMICILALVLLMLLVRLIWPETLTLNLVDPFSATSLIGSPLAKGILVLILFLKQMFYTSLILGIFNLIPIPPLDGSWILSGILPQTLRGSFERIRRFGFFLLILFTLTPILDYVLGIPIGIVWLGLREMVAAIGFA